MCRYRLRKRRFGRTLCLLDTSHAGKDVGGVLARELPTMPRVRYRPWTLYEEAVGLKGARRIAWAGWAFLGFNISLMMSMLASFGATSRHLALSPEENARYSQHVEDRWSTLWDTMAGKGPKAIPQSGYASRGPR